MRGIPVIPPDDEFADSGKAEREWQRTYDLNGFRLVPSYKHKNVFALPGGGFIRLHELLMRGATESNAFLWRRAR